MIQERGRNIGASQDLLAALSALGVSDVAVCAGARNSPLVMVLDRTEGLHTHSFFEERSAAFFMLGRARRNQAPAAVITTSGTAAAELLPAVIEAFHAGVPLILVTADRPRRLRGTGAPQAIDQIGLFAKFVEKEIDVEAGETIDLGTWTRRAPLHINICFDEPLLDGPVQDLRLTPAAAVRNDAPRTADFSEKLQSFLAQARKPIAVVGTLSAEKDRQAVETFLKAAGIPVYAEATSGLRESRRLAGQTLGSGDRVLSWALARDHFDSVLRIGGVPTVRIWRDLDEPTSKVDVLSISPCPFAGLSRGELLHGDLSRLDSVAVKAFPRAAGEAIYERDRAGIDLLVSLFQREPKAEPSMVHKLARLVPGDALMYVGNSLPIREWDLAAPLDRPRAVEANRGVNGIDGQLSTFLGLLPEGREGWGLVGDLTALYDLTAPWALSGMPSTRVRFVVLNNGGGKIFSRIFKTDLFENQHSLSFEGWAKMWNLPYELWTEVPAQWSGSEHVVIEMKPEAEATARFWDAYDSFWMKS